MRVARSAISSTDRALHSRRISELLVADAIYREAKVVAAYVAIGSEADPAGFMRTAHRDGKRVAVPRVEPDGTLSLHLWTPESPLVEGPLGLREPRPGAEVMPREVQLVIVPGMAFDMAGGRLGRGKAYYDKLLLRTGPAVRVGLAFYVQLIEAVPMEAHDVPMDLIATEQGLHRCPPRP